MRNPVVIAIAETRGAALAAALKVTRTGNLRLIERGPAVLDEARRMGVADGEAMVCEADKPDA